MNCVKVLRSIFLYTYNRKQAFFGPIITVSSPYSFPQAVPVICLVSLHFYSFIYFYILLIVSYFLIFRAPLYLITVPLIFTLLLCSIWSSTSQPAFAFPLQHCHSCSPMHSMNLLKWISGLTNVRNPSSTSFLSWVLGSPYPWMISSLVSCSPRDIDDSIFRYGGISFRS